MAAPFLSRAIPAAFALMGIFTEVGPATAGPSAQSEAFTLAVLPDTQFYCSNPAWTHQFLAQTAWIAFSSGTRNIAFVSHLGDIVQSGNNNGNTIEWQRANSAMSTLDGLVPYAAAIGNHDYNTVSDKASGATAYTAWFGPARYAG